MWGLGVQVWTRTWTPGQEGDGLVLLVPGVQAGRVFSGHSAGHIGSRIIAESVRLGYGLAP